MNSNRSYSSIRIPFITLFLVIMVFFCILNASAQTNATVQNVLEETKATVQETIKTNYNQVMIEILSGIKGAGSEIYGASKAVIKNSVDFAVEQAPDVVHQFLLWKFSENILYIVVGIGGISFALYFAKKLREWARADKQDEEARFLLYLANAIVIGIACAVFFISTVSHISNTIKISVAPKVYLIEYVVDLAKGTPTNGK